ncbi:hypothetical protein [Sedimentibacter sp.]|uniref:hypothetical protein n=1 Tax=Sedimentibacter sp. TaxID=1960295 RepID=UPI0028ABB245|nr:hypothetical protein [Sedimentibacter sp.]
MRFCDFFVEYKLEMYNIKSTMHWNELSFYRKCTAIFIFIITVMVIIFSMLNPLILMSISVITLIFIGIFNSKKEIQRKMLDEHYVKYSKKRMEVFFKLLDKYNISITNTKNLVLLIEQAKDSKTRYDPFLSLNKPFKILGTTIIPIIIYVAQKLAETTSTNELIFLSLQTITIIICLFSIIISITPIIKEIVYQDSIHYDRLIYDINQVLIFYNKENNINI